MTSRDFCYWLQGAFELFNPEEGLTSKQLDVVKNHLNLVFRHEIDPSMGDEQHQESLNMLHTPSSPFGTVVRC